MRKLIFLLCITIAAIASAAPELKWLKYSHNFGIFNEEDGLVYCTFEAINIGDEPLAVIDARANCGCTQPTYTREPIAPGDTLVVKVAYNPASRPGKFNKQVKLTTNAKLKTSILTVRGTVLGSPATMRSRYPQEVGAYRVSNNITPFGATRKGRVLAAGLQIYNPTSDTIQPVAKNFPPYINVVFKPTAIPPGEQGVMSMTAYTAQAPSYGINEGSLTLFPSKNSSDSIVLTTTAKVNEDFSKLTPVQIEKAPVAKLSNDSVDFGIVSAIDCKEPTAELSLTNLGETPLILHQLYTNNKALTINTSTTKIQAGKKATIKISLNPALLTEKQRLEGIIDLSIILTTNDPKTPEQIIRIVGQLK